MGPLERTEVHPVHLVRGDVTLDSEQPYGTIVGSLYRSVHQTPLDRVPATVGRKRDRTSSKEVS